MPSRALLLGLALLAGASGCQRQADPGEATSQDTGAESAGSALPDLELRDDTPGVLITWVDGEGEFRVAERPEQVPESARETVRIVIQGKPAGTPESVYVANLTAKQDDGRYPVRVLPRSAWDELGAARRKARLKELAPEPPPEASATTIIYGADWCKPCHQAEEYLRKQNVPVVLKDIERDPKAQAEMQAKLSSANLRNASIPVIDVGGTLLIGFSPRALDAALKKLPRTDSGAPPG